MTVALLLSRNLLEQLLFFPFLIPPERTAQHKVTIRFIVMA